MAANFDGPEFSKYRTLFKCHLPEGAIVQKMTVDGFDENIIQDFLRSLSSGPQSATSHGTGPSPGSTPAAGSSFKLKDDPAYAKYFKMLKMHLPRGAVEQKMAAEGVDTSVLDMDPEGPSPNAPMETSQGLRFES